MVVQLNEFFGGGYNVSDLSSNTQLPVGCGRVIVVDAISSPSSFLQMPFKAIPKIRRRGFPHFLIVNRDLSNSLKIANFNTTSTRYTLAADRCVYVGLDADNNWSFSEAKVFDSDN